MGTENVSSVRAAVAHLLELGHRRVAFVGNLDGASTVSDRREGWRRALDDVGLEPVLEAAFAPREGESDLAAARRAAQTVLDLRATAIFAVNDSVALLLVQALRDLGACVPEDVSVVGFDGGLAWLPNGGPLTTARQNFALIGEIAGETLLARLRPDSSSTYRHVLLDAPLSLGGSSAPPRRTGPDHLLSLG